MKEVGKKYWRRDCKGWGKVIADTAIECPLMYNREYPLIVYDSFGHSYLITRDGKISIEGNECPPDLMEEYDEPLKRSIKGWIGYENYKDAKIPAATNVILEHLIGFRCSSIGFSSKEETLSKWPNIMYGRFTFEQLPEPPEK